MVHKKCTLGMENIYFFVSHMSLGFCTYAFISPLKCSTLVAPVFPLKFSVITKNVPKMFGLCSYIGVLNFQNNFNVSTQLTVQSA